MSELVWTWWTGGRFETTDKVVIFKNYSSKNADLWI
jgi:hypothetical protein